MNDDSSLKFRAAINVLFHWLTLRLFHWLIVKSIKCQRIVKNSHHKSLQQILTFKWDILALKWLKLLMNNRNRWQLIFFPSTNHGSSRPELTKFCTRSSTSITTFVKVCCYYTTKLKLSPHLLVCVCMFVYTRNMNRLNQLS